MFFCLSLFSVIYPTFFFYLPCNFRSIFFFSLFFIPNSRFLLLDRSSHVFIFYCLLSLFTSFSFYCLVILVCDGLFSSTIVWNFEEQKKIDHLGLISLMEFRLKRIACRKIQFLLIQMIAS